MNETVLALMLWISAATGWAVPEPPNIKYTDSGQELFMLSVIYRLVLFIFFNELGRRCRGVHRIQTVEEGIKLVVLLLCEWIIFVRMTLAAAKRNPQPNLPDGVRAIHRPLHTILFAIDAAFGVEQRVA